MSEISWENQFLQRKRISVLTVNVWGAWGKKGKQAGVCFIKNVNSSCVALHFQCSTSNWGQFLQGTNCLTHHTSAHLPPSKSRERRLAGCERLERRDGDLITLFKTFSASLCSLPPKIQPSLLYKASQCPSVYSAAHYSLVSFQSPQNHLSVSSIQSAKPVMVKSVTSPSLSSPCRSVPSPFLCRCLCGGRGESSSIHGSFLLCFSGHPQRRSIMYLVLPLSPASPPWHLPRPRVTSTFAVSLAASPLTRSHPPPCRSVLSSESAWGSEERKPFHILGSLHPRMRASNFPSSANRVLQCKYYPGHQAMLFFSPSLFSSFLPPSLPSFVLNVTCFVYIKCEK